MEIRKISIPSVRSPSAQSTITKSADSKPAEKPLGESKLEIMVDTSVRAVQKASAEGAKSASGFLLGMALALGLLGTTAPYGFLMTTAVIIGGLSGIALQTLANKYLTGKSDGKLKRALKKFQGALREISDNFVKLVKSMPKFIYPSVHHATPEQVKLVYDTMDKLPISYVTATHTVNFDPNLAKELNAAGLNQQLFFDRPVTLDVSQMAISEDWARYVITHELGHANDFLHAQHLNGFISSMKPFNKPPYVTDYARTNQFEDLAESYAHYHLMPEKLKEIAPEKYEALAKVEAVKSVDPLNMIASQPPLRKLGRAIGELLSKLPYPVRMFTVALGTSLPLYSFSKAADDLAEGKGDRLKAKSIATSALAAILTPPSVTLATVVEGIALKRAVKRGKISEETAHRILDSTIALILGPLGGALKGVLDGLRSKRGSKRSEISKSTPENLGKPQNPSERGNLREEIEVDKRDWAKFLGGTALAVALGVGIGLALGPALGGLLGSLIASQNFTAGAVAELVGGRLIATGISYGASRAVSQGLKKLLG